MHKILRVKSDNDLISVSLSLKAGMRDQELEASGD